IVHALRDQAFGDADADAGDVQTAAIKHLHGDLEALALLAQAQRRRYARIVEVDVTDMGTLLAHLLFRLAHRNALKICRHDERRDAACTFAVRLAPRPQAE